MKLECLIGHILELEDMESNQHHIIRHPGLERAAWSSAHSERPLIQRSKFKTRKLSLLARNVKRNQEYTDSQFSRNRRLIWWLSTTMKFSHREMTADLKYTE